MKSVYIETTIPSLITSWASRDTVVAGRQAVTINFWENERHKYDLYVSQFVLNECSQGDTDAATRRLELIKEIQVLQDSDQVAELADAYQKLLNIPEKAKVDCFHLAVSVIYKMDYLLSWNCTHLGARTLLEVEKYNAKRGLHTPILTTPEAFMEIEMEG